MPELSNRSGTDSVDGCAGARKRPHLTFPLLGFDKGAKDVENSGMEPDSDFPQKLATVLQRRGAVLHSSRASVFEEEG